MHGDQSGWLDGQAKAAGPGQGQGAEVQEQQSGWARPEARGIGGQAAAPGLSPLPLARPRSHLGPALQPPGLACL